jgi:hypothetical protein
MEEFSRKIRACACPLNVSTTTGTLVGGPVKFEPLKFFCVSSYGAEVYLRTQIRRVLKGKEPVNVANSELPDSTSSISYSSMSHKTRFSLERSLITTKLSKLTKGTIIAPNQ